MADALEKESQERESYAAVLLPQGEHRFYQLSMPSDVLSQCTFVSTREEDPEHGFQRLLDVKRAQQIADYLDSGLGTIPTSIILSAQSEADFEYDSRAKVARFNKHSNAFLILDGQHRVFAFRLAKKSMRIPVVIYNGLSRRDEARLFMDINSKQRGVPNELLLDIKGMAEYESSEEERLSSIFDLFLNNADSPLFGRVTPSKKASSKISRVTFYAALRSINQAVISRTPSEVYNVLANYLHSISSLLIKLEGDDDKLSQPTPFKAFIAFFISAASKVKDRNGADYSTENFQEVLQPAFQKLKSSQLSGSSAAKIKDYLEKSLKTDFSL